MTEKGPAEGEEDKNTEGMINRGRRGEREEMRVCLCEKETLRWRGGEQEETDV